MEVFFIILFIGAVLIALGILQIVTKRHKHGDYDLRESIFESEKRQQEALHTFQNRLDAQMLQFQQMMYQSLTQIQEAGSKQMFAMETQMHAYVNQGSETTSKAFHEVLKHMGKLDESQRHLEDLSKSIGSIQNVLTDKKTRGIFGEIELYALLEDVIGTAGQRYAKQYRLSTNVIADAVLFASKPLQLICIDAKFPLENYNRVMDSNSEKKRAHACFVSDVKKHIKTIADKYIISQETADFAFMFLPAEAIFAYIYASCDEVVRYSYEHKVYMVSPTTLFAYVTAIRAIYLGVERNENLEEMQKELKGLHLEFERFKKRYEAFQNDMEHCYQNMQQLSITAGKMIRRFEQIENVKLSEKKHQDLGN